MAKYEVHYEGKVISRLDIKKEMFEAQEAALKRALPTAELVEVKEPKKKKKVTTDEEKESE